MNSQSKMLEQQLQKSKSLCSLDKEHVYREKEFFSRPLSRTMSDSSIDVYFINESDSEGYDDKRKDSGICDKSVFEGDTLLILEQKIDKLSDMFLEQCRLLTMLKNEIRSSETVMKEAVQAHNKVLADILRDAISERIDLDDQRQCSRAQTLLNAIENKRDLTLNDSIREAITSFLQSEELKQRMVNATAESVKQVIDGRLSRDISNLFLPFLELSHRRLVKHINRIVEEAFSELERNSFVLTKSVDKTSKNLQRALERHQNMLKAASEPNQNMFKALQITVEELLHDELKQWRVKVLHLLSLQPEEEPRCEEFVTETRVDARESPSLLSVNTPSFSPPQPANQEVSLIDQLMRSAEITKMISDGRVDLAFSVALQAADLGLVLVACKAAWPLPSAPSTHSAPSAHSTPSAPSTPCPFYPCALSQPVLLSLVQQLTTDMVHDTQIKCRYLEEAIINLNPNNPDTRAHLPLVVREVKTHLTDFLWKYPSHVAHRRISLIIIAADNLLK